jgi:hypothetical protein
MIGQVSCRTPRYENVNLLEKLDFIMQQRLFLWVEQPHKSDRRPPLFKICTPVRNLTAEAESSRLARRNDCQQFNGPSHCLST